MKKILSCISSFLILYSIISCSNFDNNDKNSEKISSLYYLSSGDNSSTKITEKKFTMYYQGSPVNDIKLYFLNDVNDLPYIEVDECVELLKFLYDDSNGLTASKADSIVTLVRNNKTYGVNIPTTIDFEKDSILFQDYDLFTMTSEKSTILDITSLETVDAQNRPIIFQKTAPKYLPRFGDSIEFKLKDYGIDLPFIDGKYFLPLQTFSDIFIAPIKLNNLYFNGKCVIIANDFSVKGNQASKELYYQGEHGERSPVLTKFGYNELCMILDKLYGLKDHKEISSFDKLFQTVGSSSVATRAIVEEQSLKSYLLGPSVLYADKAIYTLIGDFLDDNHSKWYNFSYLTGEHDGYEPNGLARERLAVYTKRYKDARAAVYGDSVPAYEEVDDTAFITFDAFELGVSDLDKYYNDSIDELAKKDTIALIMYAHNKITRENSPIENVVIDLSCNLGGAADTAIFVISWFLGEAEISIKNTMTGALCTTPYRCDANRDHEFDDNDTLGDRKLFCLVSPVSFSCGNFVPNAFKESEKVTLLGKTSAGGACVVQPLSTAWGTCFRISGPLRISYMKNGSYYDVDQGAEPDYTISSPENYYNRSELVSYINSLK